MAKLQITEVHFGLKYKIIKKEKKLFIVKKKWFCIWKSIGTFRTLKGSILFIQSLVNERDEDPNPDLGGDLVLR